MTDKTANTAALNSYLSPLGVAVAALSLVAAALAASPAAADGHGGGYGYGSSYGGYGAAKPQQTAETKSWGESTSWEQKGAWDAAKPAAEPEEFRNFGGVPIPGATDDLRRRKRFNTGDN